MTTPYHIALNGTTLSSLDDAICVLDVFEEAPVIRSTAIDAYGGGQRILRRERESLRVQAAFAIQEPDVLRRQEIFRRVLAWADNGGALTISGRSGQQLQVICTGLPACHAEDWTETLHLTFSTILVPFWEAAAGTSADASPSAALNLPGNAGLVPVSVQVYNRGSSSLTSLQLTCGDTQMVFDNLSLAPGASLTLHYTGGVLTAEANGESLLRCRTPGSDDLLLAPCGRSCPVNVSADQPVTATFSARGRYL